MFLSTSRRIKNDEWNLTIQIPDISSLKFIAATDDYSRFIYYLLPGITETGANCALINWIWP